MKLLEGKSAIVTGSGRGIGRAIAMLFAEHGAHVVVNDLDGEVAESVVNSINASGGVATACVGSVTAPDFPAQIVQTAVQEFKKLDILVNNAGYTWDGVIQNVTDEMWDAMIDVHLKAPFRLIRAAVPYLRDVAKQEVAAGKRRASQDHQRLFNFGYRGQSRSGELLGGQDGDCGCHEDNGQRMGTL